MIRILSLRRAKNRCSKIMSPLEDVLARVRSIAAELSQNLEAVDTAIRAFVADGTIDRLSARWLGEKLGSADDNIPLIRTKA